MVPMVPESPTRDISDLVKQRDIDVEKISTVICMYADDIFS